MLGLEVYKLDLLISLATLVVPNYGYFEKYFINALHVLHYMQKWADTNYFKEVLLVIPHLSG